MYRKKAHSINYLNEINECFNWPQGEFQSFEGSFEFYVISRCGRRQEIKQ